MISAHSQIEQAAQLQDAARSMAQMIGRPGANAYITVEHHGDLRGRMLFKSKQNPLMFFLITLMHNKGTVQSVYTTGTLTGESSKEIPDGAFNTNCLPKKWYKDLKPHQKAPSDPFQVAIELKGAL